MPDNDPVPNAPVSAAPPVAAHGGGHAFDFDALNKSHNYPYPAIEWIHGKPALILNAPDYAAVNYPLLKDQAQGVTAKPGYEGWATAWMQKSGWKDADARQLAQVMTVADQKAWLGSMPQSLSFFTHQTFWSTVALSLMALCLLVFFRRKPDQYKPVGRMQHIFETLVLFVRDEIVRPNMHHGEAWTPFIASLFLALLSCNLFGLVPLFATATGNIGVTAAWSLVTLLLMVVMGMKLNGVVGFWGSIVPVKWEWKPFPMALWSFLFVNEIISLISRPVILAVRLFANMFAGHITVLVFVSLGFVVFAGDGTAHTLATSLGIFGWVMTIALYALELLVCVIQAFIFTMLTAVFIGLCMHPEH